MHIEKNAFSYKQTMNNTVSVHSKVQCTGHNRKRAILVLRDCLATMNVRLFLFNTICPKWVVRLTPRLLWRSSHQRKHNVPSKVGDTFSAFGEYVCWLRIWTWSEQNRNCSVLFLRSKFLLTSIQIQSTSCFFFIRILSVTQTFQNTFWSKFGYIYPNSINKSLD